MLTTEQTELETMTGAAQEEGVSPPVLETTGPLTPANETPDYMWRKCSADVSSTKTAAEALEATGDLCNWSVVVMAVPGKLPKATASIFAQPSVLVGPLKQEVEQSGTALQILIRDSDNRVLHSHGERYKVIQPRELFSCADPLIESGKVAPESMGVLRDGKNVWFVAKINKECEICEGDFVSPYAVFHISYDGISAAGVSVLDVVHTNKVVITSIQSCGYNFKYNPAKSQELNSNQLSEELSEYIDSYESCTVRLFSRLSEKTITRENASSYISRVLGYGSASASGEVQACVLGSVAEREETAWNLLNAIGYYLNHSVKSKGPAESAYSARWNSILYGHGGKALTKALSAIESI